MLALASMAHATATQPASSGAPNAAFVRQWLSDIVPVRADGGAGCSPVQPPSSAGCGSYQVASARSHGGLAMLPRSGTLLSARPAGLAQYEASPPLRPRGASPASQPLPPPPPLPPSPGLCAASWLESRDAALDTSASYATPPPQTILPDGSTTSPAQQMLRAPRAISDGLRARAPSIAEPTARHVASGVSSCAPCPSVHVSTSASLELPPVASPRSARKSARDVARGAPRESDAPAREMPAGGEAHAGASLALCRQLKDLLQSDERGSVLAALRAQGLRLSEAGDAGGDSCTPGTCRSVSAGSRGSRGSPTALYRPMREIMMEGAATGTAAQVRCHASLSCKRSGRELAGHPCLPAHSAPAIADLLQVCRLWQRP